MGLYIIGGVPMRIGDSHRSKEKNRSKAESKRRNVRRKILMAWLLRKKEITRLRRVVNGTVPHGAFRNTEELDLPVRQDETLGYEVGYMEERKIFVEGMGTMMKFEFNPVYTFGSIEEAENKVNFLNGGGLVSHSKSE